MSETPDNQELIARLNGETAKINWHELQKHYALGNVLAVSEGGDLIQVAIALHKDNSTQIQQWLNEKVVLEVSDQQALTWYESNATVWALVIPPFILVQAVSE
jgi:hypothetical protein